MLLAALEPLCPAETLMLFTVLDPHLGPETMLFTLLDPHLEPENMLFTALDPHRGKLFDLSGSYPEPSHTGHLTA